MSIYSHYLESTVISKISKNEVVDVITKIAEEIEKIYNSECTKIGIHEEHNTVSVKKQLNDNGDKVTHIEYYFSTYHDPDNDWEHSFEYYDSGNSGLSREQEQKIIKKYNDIINKIEIKLAQLIKKYNKYNIKYSFDDYRGTQIIIFAELNDEQVGNIKKLKEAIGDIFKENLSKFKSKNPISKYVDYDFVGSGKNRKYVQAIHYSAVLIKKYVDSNKIQFVKNIKNILENINNLYKENSNLFDSNYLNINLKILDTADELYIYMYIYEYDKTYNKKMYNSINLPPYCLNIILGEKQKQKIDPYKRQFFNILDKKIKENFNINNNSNINYSDIDYSSSKNYFFVNYYFSEYSRDSNNAPILNTLRKLKSQDEIKKFKNIITETINDFLSNNKDLKITQSWRWNGSIKYYFEYTIAFGLPFNDNDLNI